MIKSQTASLLGAIERAICRYVKLGEQAQVAALALFVMHTWVFEAAHATPYVTVLSPDKQSGKTRLLEVLALLVAKGWLVSNVTPAVVFRRIESEQPTLLLDEVDTIFSRDGGVNEALRGVLNAANRPGAKVSRCTGDGHEPRDFNIYCPKVIAGIDNGRLPDTIRDRAITIRMKRKLSTETVDLFRHRDFEPLAEKLRGLLERWGAANLGALAAARPPSPDGLSDRMAEAWEPLLAIADLAGGTWPSRARNAACDLHAARDPDNDNDAVRLLRAIHTAFGEKDRMSTRELLKAINDDEELPFGAANRGGGMSPRELADNLRSFEISPHTIRQGANVNQRGYRRSQFEDAWARYLAPLPPEDPPHRHIAPRTPQTAATSDDGSSQTAQIVPFPASRHSMEDAPQSPELTEDDLEPHQRNLLCRLEDPA